MYWIVEFTFSKANIPVLVKKLNAILFLKNGVNEQPNYY